MRICHRRMSSSDVASWAVYSSRGVQYVGLLHRQMLNTETCCAASCAVGDRADSHDGLSVPVAAAELAGPVSRRSCCSRGAITPFLLLRVIEAVGSKSDPDAVARAVNAFKVMLPLAAPSTRNDLLVSALETCFELWPCLASTLEFRAGAAAL